MHFPDYYLENYPDQTHRSIVLLFLEKFKLLDFNFEKVSLLIFSREFSRRPRKVSVMSVNHSGKLSAAVTKEIIPFSSSI